MVLYVITDTYENSRQEQFWRHKFALEEAAGDTCVLLHYSQATADAVAWH